MLATNENPCFGTYIERCINCDGENNAATSERSGDPYLMVCATCDKRTVKGVLINNKRSYLNNVG